MPKMRPYVDGDWNCVLDLCLRAFAPACESLGRLAGAEAIGPILLGTRAPVTILTPTATVRRIINLTAVTAVEAAARA